MQKCEEAQKGSITIGKRADLVMLSDDPNRVAPDDIETICFMTTIIGGKIIFDQSSGRAQYS